MRIKFTSFEKQRQKHEKELLKWHDWFAWHPVRISDTELVWLETIKRKAISITPFGSIASWLFKMRYL